jgi:hypothetical protein
MKPHFRPNRSRRRQKPFLIVFLAAFLASPQLITVVAGFNNLPKHVPLFAALPHCHIYTSDRNQWYCAGKNRRRAFIKTRRSLQQLPTLRRQMQQSDIPTNSTSSLPSISPTQNVTRLSSSRMYDLGVGKHSPLNSSTADSITKNVLPSATDNETVDDNFVADNESSATTNNAKAMNARLFGMHWMVPESVVKPSTATAQNDNISLLRPEPSLQNSNEQMTKTEKKSRRMVAYVFLIRIMKFVQLNLLLSS